jgi:hypothetical protein
MANPAVLTANALESLTELGPRMRPEMNATPLLQIARHASPVKVFDITRQF